MTLRWRARASSLLRSLAAWQGGNADQRKDCERSMPSTIETNRVVRRADTLPLARRQLHLTRVERILANEDHLAVVKLALQDGRRTVSSLRLSLPVAQKGGTHQDRVLVGLGTCDMEGPGALALVALNLAPHLLEDRASADGAALQNGARTFVRARLGKVTLKAARTRFHRSFGMSQTPSTNLRRVGTPSTSSSSSITCVWGKT